MKIAKQVISATWATHRRNAARLSNVELARHAMVSKTNRCNCNQCFTCACLARANAIGLRVSV